MDRKSAFFSLLFASSLLLAGCSSSVNGGGATPPPPTSYTLSVNSASPASGVDIKVSPADSNNAGNGTTPFTRTYLAGTSVTLTAPVSVAGANFSSWSGCAVTVNAVCSVSMTAQSAVTATYIPSPITSVTVTPNPAAATIGATLQFTAVVAGTGAFDNTVTWSVAAPTGSSLSPGTISASGLYTTPYPAPATVTVVATSNQDSSKSGSVTVPLSPPAAAAGPSLTVDAANQTHPINPYIYGMNGWGLAQATATSISLPIDRWGGDGTQRYNYLTDFINSASDWYFENSISGGGTQDTGGFNQQVQADKSIGSRTLGTVDVMGWVAKDGASCSFPSSIYPNQTGHDPYRASCGNGVYPQGVSGCASSGGCAITGNDPTLTSTAINPAAWAGAWVTYLVGKFGNAASGGIAVYDLDNEPSWWDAVHRDVHPVAFTYDEMTNNGIAVAQAVKTADPTAEVSGPVMDYWWDYFYSKKDVEAGWSSGPCWQPWSNPVDRNAHGGTPLIEYYLQQFKQYEDTHHTRLLDYLDLHTYFVASYNGASLGFATAGDTGAQQARLNSTRVFWDPTYTDPNFPQPNYLTDTSYTSSCSTPLQAPQVIPMMRNWVARDYPGTKLAITEYNWGGQEHINGALAQADILGIFGREGLDIGALWGPPDPATQIPGLVAFKAFRNYDGANSKFGDIALSSTSADQGKLSVYGALRSSDSQVTVVVLNKTYGDLTTTLSLANLVPNGPAKVFLYSSANLAAIVAQPDLAVTLPPASTTAQLSATFPAQSITILVIPKA